MDLITNEECQSKEAEGIFIVIEVVDPLWPNICVNEDGEPKTFKINKGL